MKIGIKEQEFWNKYNDGVRPKDYYDWSMKNEHLQTEYYTSFSEDCATQYELDKPLIEAKLKSKGALTIKELIVELSKISNQEQLVTCEQFYVTGVTNHGNLNELHYEAGDIGRIFEI